MWLGNEEDDVHTPSSGHVHTDSKAIWTVNNHLIGNELSSTCVKQNVGEVSCPFVVVDHPFHIRYLLNMNISAWLQCLLEFDAVNIMSQFVNPCLDLTYQLIRDIYGGIEKFQQVLEVGT